MTWYFYGSSRNGWQFLGVTFLNSYLKSFIYVSFVHLSVLIGSSNVVISTLLGCTEVKLYFPCHFQGVMAHNIFTVKLTFLMFSIEGNSCYWFFLIKFFRASVLSEVQLKGTHKLSSNKLILVIGMLTFCTENSYLYFQEKYFICIFSFRW